MIYTLSAELMTALNLSLSVVIFLLFTAIAFLFFVIYSWELLCSCWLEDPNGRPSFTTIYEFLDKLLDGTNFNPQSSYSYIRDYTKDIPSDYVDDPIEVEVRVQKLFYYKFPPFFKD